MRLYVKPKNMEAERWFAWHPVWVKEARAWVWLEDVIRRRQLDESGLWWYYRLPAYQDARSQDNGTSEHQ